MKKTLKNKLAAIALISVGIMPTLLEGDASFLVSASLFAVPLFLSKNDCFEDRAYRGLFSFRHTSYCYE